MIEIVPVGRSETRGLSKEILCDIMQPRAVELLQHIAHEISAQNAQIPSGVILTGGGSMARGMVEVAEQVFDAPTRLGIPDEHLFGGHAETTRRPEWAVACVIAHSSMRMQIREGNAAGRSPTRKMAEWFETFREKFR
jgi:cell division protein FtsA